MLIDRTHLRSNILDEVIARWTDGRLAPGRINESALADELGISRTPLREALLVMTQRGMLEATLGRGFSVRALCREEAADLYPLLAVLEPMALRLGFAAARRNVENLRTLLHAMTTTDATDELQHLAVRWSTMLMEGCENRRLTLILGDLYQHAARYEHATLERGFPVASAIEHHRAIVDAIESGEVALAAERLGATWQRCLDALLAWLPAAADIHTPIRRFKR
jgi:DNA-binding GntR family transcriptional regulator